MNKTPTHTVDTQSRSIDLYCCSYLIVCFSSSCLPSNLYFSLHYIPPHLTCFLIICPLFFLLHLSEYCPPSLPPTLRLTLPRSSSPSLSLPSSSRLSSRQLFSYLTHSIYSFELPPHPRGRPTAHPTATLFITNRRHVSTLSQISPMQMRCKCGLQLLLRFGPSVLSLAFCPSVINERSLHRFSSPADRSAHGPAQAELLSTSHSPQPSMCHPEGANAALTCRSLASCSRGL